MQEKDHDAFEQLVRAVEPHLRRALVATYGPERGREATAEALAWAFEHQEKLDSMTNPGAYLYRVGQSRSRTRRVRRLYERPSIDEPWFEPALAATLAALPEKQRFAVLMVHGAGWTQSEVAALLGVRPATLQKRVERAMKLLRVELRGVSDEPV